MNSNVTNFFEFGILFFFCGKLVSKFHLQVLNGRELPYAQFIKCFLCRLTCVTTDPQLVSRDEILVYGRDLGELNANSPYARIALIQVGDIESDDLEDTEQAFRAIQNIDFVKCAYRVNSAVRQIGV